MINVSDLKAGMTFILDGKLKYNILVSFKGDKHNVKKNYLQ